MCNLEASTIWNVTTETSLKPVLGKHNPVGILTEGATLMPPSFNDLQSVRDFTTPQSISPGDSAPWVRTEEAFQIRSETFPESPVSTHVPLD